MLEAGIIGYLISPWCHWTKIVPKKDGDLQMVHNHVPINAATVANSYPMRRIELVLKSLMQPGLNVYFQADAANGYWAIPLAQEHAYKTAFGTHRRQYHYLHMGQGLSGAPQTYTRLKDVLAGPIPESNKEPALDQFDVAGGTFQYFMDDDFGTHRTYDDQWRLLHSAYFPRLAWGRFTLRPKKTGFFLEKITPLAFFLRGEGLRPSEDKVAAIRDYPTPTSLDKVNRFLWMTTYLRHFIPGRSDHAVVLKAAAQLESKEEWHRRDVGKKDKNGRVQRGPRRVVDWHWGPRQEESFAALKRAVIENAVFGSSELRQYHLSTDASKTGIGVVLFQLITSEPGKKISVQNRQDMRIVMFISLRLADAETRYSTTEQETLAVLRCLKAVSWFVQGSAYPVFAYTDHSALVHLLKHDDTHGKMAIWQQKLSQYDLEYLHVPGTQNAVADGLSRMPTRYFEGKQMGKQLKEKEGGQGRGMERGGTDERVRWEGASGREKNNDGGKTKSERGGEKKRDTLQARGGLKGWSRLAEQAAVRTVGENEGIAGGVHVGGDLVREGEKRGEERDWEVWKKSEWYGEVVRYLLRGDFKNRRVKKEERRRIRAWARRFVLFDRERRKGLFYEGKDGKLALCILPDDVLTTLECYHDCHGHFTRRLLTGYLLGKVYWPT